MVLGKGHVLNIKLLSFSQFVLDFYAVIGITHPLIFQGLISFFLVPAEQFRGKSHLYISIQPFYRQAYAKTHLAYPCDALLQLSATK